MADEKPNKPKAKSSGKAVVLTLLFPGIGHFYLGKYIKGFVYAFIQTIFIGMAMGAKLHYFQQAVVQKNIGTFPGITFFDVLSLCSWLLFMALAYYDSETINEVYALSQKKCPYCAEFVKYEATVCRFCSRDLVSEDRIH